MPLTLRGLTLGADDFIAGKSVLNYAALPSAAANSGQLAIVLNSQGTWPLASYKAAGIYYSDGATWIYQGDYALTDQASEIQFTPAGTVSATDVQAAIVEVSGDVTAQASAYSELFNNAGTHTAGLGAATYSYAYQRATAASGATTGGTISVIGIFSADYPAIGTLTAKLRIRGALQTNATAPTGSYRFALFPISPTAGAAGAITYTVGTEVTGSTTGTSTTPTANTAVALVGSDFALPADGQYTVCLVTTGTVAANAHIGVNATLQIHWS